MTPLEDYLAREKAAAATPEGRDHAAIVAQVAQDHGVSARELADAIIAETVKQGAG